MPSFATIISALSIVFYCAGFLRVELEIHEQKKIINALESVVEAKAPSNNIDMKIIKNAVSESYPSSKRLRDKTSSKRSCSTMFRSRRNPEVIPGKALFNPPLKMISLSYD